MKSVKWVTVLFFLSVAVFGSYHLFETRGLSEGCEQVFSTPFYSHYRSQLQAFFTSHPTYSTGQSVKDLIVTTQASTLDREGHEAFVIKLRHAIKDATNTGIDQADHRLLCDLVNWIFLEADLQSSVQDFFYTFIPRPDGDLLDYLSAVRQALYDDHRFNSSLLYKILADSYLEGNLPYSLVKLSPPRTTKVVRMAHPLTEFSALPWSLPKVSPEFALFLQNNPRHLYVNLMKRKGSESRHTYVIEQLERQYPHVSVVTLDKDSPFYRQDPSCCPDSMHPAAFKKVFLEQLLDDRGNYFWSKNLDKAEWELRLVDVLDTMHDVYFPNKRVLDRQERCDMIELAYLAILDALVDALEPTSMNITCKQAMDRAPALTCLWLFQKNALDKDALAALLLAPPMLVHNRASHAARIGRFISAARRIEGARQ